MIIYLTPQGTSFQPGRGVTIGDTQFPPKVFLREDMRQLHGVTTKEVIEPDYDPLTQAKPKQDESGEFLPPENLSPEHVQENMKRHEMELDNAIQQRLDDIARERGYTAGMDRLCSYVNSTDTQWAAEGLAGVKMRDATWAKAAEILAEVQAGTRPVPKSIKDFEAELPKMTWPQ